MNGLTGARRLARPVRLAIAPSLGTGEGLIDGAWWPHTGSVASELPELIALLQQPLGEIVDIRINWSATEGPLDLNTITATRLPIGDALKRRPRLMVVAGQSLRVTLLVLPHMTSQGLGAIVMRKAVGAPVGTSRDAKLFAIADFVMQAAHDESARWSAVKPAG
ncbi:MAG: hypothetical protein K0R68_1346 [Mycobacterium sp.]|jgi:hypothetical protein|nr:hypothetical protein [Mycobacterium sp.]